MSDVDRGMGSVNTTVLRSPQDLEKVLSKGLANCVDAPVDLEIEEFIQVHNN